MRRVAYSLPLMRPQRQGQRWLYRTGQFFKALLGKVSLDEMAEARQVLGHDLYPMFEELPAQYRHHMLAVYRRVRDAGCGDRHVWQAALLHDVGKYDPATRRYVSIPYRVAVVVLAVVPQGRHFLRGVSAHGSVRPVGWFYPFYLNRTHAQLGAERASRYGAHPEVIELVANHHNHAGNSNKALAALQAADERS